MSEFIAPLHCQRTLNGDKLTVYRSMYAHDRCFVELVDASGVLRSSHKLHAGTWEHDVELLTGIAIVSAPSL